MQFEAKITTEDLKVILNNAMSGGHQVAIRKRGTELIEGCSVIDFNDKTHFIAVVRKKDTTPEVIEIAFQDIELIEFDSFHTYRGVSAKAFVVE
jgi:hypothetical protein